MDCEKFETTMIDELYDELDELTSAAAKRHVAGCARCAGLLGGLRATRRVVMQSLVTVEPPVDLEERILAAARDAQKVVPIHRRVSRVVSWAGNWAMKPQTAMAAVFLLMIGSSVFLLRGKHATSASAPMTVTAEGAPAPGMLAKSDQESLDTPGAAAAHGTQDGKSKGTTATAAVAEPSATGTGLAQNTLAGDDLETKKKDGLLDRLSGGAGRDDKAFALGQGFLDEDERNGAVARRASADPSNAGAIGGAGSLAKPAAVSPTPASPPASPPPKVTAPTGAIDNGDPWGRTRGAGGASGAAPVAADAEESPPRKEAQQQRDSRTPESSASATPTFNSAKALFDARNFGEATRQFDVLAAAGDQNAALWAARSVRSASGCPSAAARFVQVAQKAPATTIGSDARLEAGQCYRQMGAFETARAQLIPLLTVQSHAQRAQRELSAMPSSAAPKPMPRKAPEQQSPYAAPPPQTAPSTGSAF